MKTRLLFMPLLFALVASLAACGGSSSVPADAVAMVGSVPITRADFNTYFKQALAIASKQSPTGAPKPGSAQYIAMQSQTVAYLVQVSELEQQAPKEKVSVSQSDVTKYLTNLAKTSYKGSMKKLEDALKAQGLTLATARQEVYVNLLAEKIHKKVTAAATVSTAQLRAYYTQNIAQYTTPAQTTRSVRHILVTTKSLADKIEKQVTNANFGKLAKQYSIDTTSHKPDGIGGSAANGGKLTAIKGQLVKSFEDVAFSLKTGEISAPVQTTYGWHIIQALGPVKNTTAHTKSFKDEESTIKSTLTQTQVDQLWSQWLSDLKSEWAGKVTYQAGYAPPTTTALTDTNLTTTG